MPGVLRIIALLSENEDGGGGAHTIGGKVKRQILILSCLGYEPPSGGDISLPKIWNSCLVQVC